LTEIIKEVTVPHDDDSVDLKRIRAARAAKEKSEAEKAIAASWRFVKRHFN
jgi:hypothetical protein